MAISYHSEAHICQCLSRLATAKRDSIVTVYGERRKTGMQFVEAVAGLARGLVELGIKPGDVVSISALNSDLYMEWMLAITYIGGIAAPLNYRWSLEEAKSAMEVAKPVMLVTDSSQGFWHSKFTIEDSHAPSSLRWHVLIDLIPVVNGLNSSQAVYAAELLKKPRHAVRTSSHLDYCWAPEKAAIICFTSGTTGKPKGATISHSAIVVQSLAKIALVGYNDDDVYLHTAPLCHIGGISSAMAVLMSGGCHVITPKFEANLACQAIREHGVTSLITVPTMMADLISSNRTKKSSSTFESVTKILNGGGGLSPELTRDAIQTFPRAAILSAYGMTEACSSITFTTLYDPTRDVIRRSKLTSQAGGVCVGKPAPHVELKIIPEEDDGSSANSSGRILMRGPHTMLHYWGQGTPSRQGWLDTGDLGQIDEHGNLWLVGREKDRIKSGGENVYPEEVESVLSQHPGISKIVVVGVPDARLTEMVVGCIQLKENFQWDDSNRSSASSGKVSSEILRQFCKKNSLTGFKIPRKFVLWRNEFPTTSTGKIRRDQIRAEVVSSQTPYLSSKL